MTQLTDIDQELKGTACVITGGLLDTIHAKTTHGLLRESKRFEIKGIVDAKFAGRDAGEFIGKPLGMNVCATISELIEQTGEKPTYVILGMATKGGRLPESLYPVILEALSLGMHVVNGLHQPISEIRELQEAAVKNHALIYDIRKPKSFEQLHFWNGKIREVNCLKLAILGTDCSTGKRTTAKLLATALNEAGIKTEMIYTGQTGWMQGTKYGFIFDATPNDFIPGEIEHAVYECWKNESPDVIIVEGQASLLNPGGPCGSEFVISARLDGVILQHHPIRVKYNNLERLPDTISDPMIDAEIIRMMGSDIWAMTLNTNNMSEEQVAESTTTLEKRSGVPVVSPMLEGVGDLVEVIRTRLEKNTMKVAEI